MRYTETEFQKIMKIGSAMIDQIADRACIELESLRPVVVDKPKEVVPPEGWDYIHWLAKQYGVGSRPLWDLARGADYQATQGLNQASSGSCGGLLGASSLSYLPSLTHYLR